LSAIPKNITRGLKKYETSLVKKYRFLVYSKSQDGWMQKEFFVSICHKLKFHIYRCLFKPLQRWW